MERTAMRTRPKALAGLWLLALASTVLANDRIVESFDPELVARVDAAVLPLIEEQQAVGYAVGLVQDGRIVFLKGYGLADRENSIPVDRATRFRWASVSKPLTAVAAMQLVESGRLDLDRDVRAYVPEWPDHGATITSRHLLCHQSGVRHYANGKIIPNRRTYADEHPFRNVVTALDVFKDSPLLFPPGERFSYSTHAYILLSAVVERAGGKPFARQVRERIAAPLGMRTLSADRQWKEIPNRAVGYRKVGGEIERSGDSDVSWKLGGGGFLSTIDDMALFAAAIVRRELLQPETWEEMWTPQKDGKGRATAYGLGFRATGEGDALRVEHSGAQQKTRTHLATLPRRGLAAVAMTNSEYGNPKEVCDAALALFEAAPTPAP